MNEAAACLGVSLHLNTEVNHLSMDIFVLLLLLLILQSLDPNGFSLSGSHISNEILEQFCGSQKMNSKVLFLSLSLL